MSRQSSFGICALCGARKGKASMTTHLKQCLRLSAGGRSTMPVVLLRVQAAYAPDFWLNVAAGRESKLDEIDGLLRHVWLECCGHLSEFYVGRYEEISMHERVPYVFERTGARINYLYDWGSTTELTISFAGFAEGTSKKPVVVARNEAPVWPCDLCDLPASSLCGDCQQSGRGFICKRHEAEHLCGEEMLLPIVNSPRMGVCGYTG